MAKITKVVKREDGRLDVHLAYSVVNKRKQIVTHRSITTVDDDGSLKVGKW